MANHAHAFLTLTILSLATILLVFGMKYFAAAREGRRSSGLLADLRGELGEVKARLQAIEKLLHDVG